MLLFLFSGRRRRIGDAEHYIEKHEHLVGRQLVSLSIDIVIDPILGNLASAKVVAFWLDQICVGRAIFAGVGPPCHTWSVARCAGAGPRVVRSAERLWGLYDLELSENRHVLHWQRAVAGGSGYVSGALLDGSFGLY